MTDKTKTATEKLVDDFIQSTWGECDPVQYRKKMVAFWDKAIRDACAAGWERHRIVSEDDGSND
jgi:hypothetical protein